LIQTPFPTLMELVRLICNAFDMGRPIKKELDNKALDLYVSLPEAMEYFRKPEIYEDLLWILGSDEGCEQFIAQVDESFKEYIEFMKYFDANGLSRDQVMPLVFRWFSHHLVNGRMIGIKHQFRVSVLDQENGLLTKALPPLIEQLKAESYAWQAMIQHAEKSLKDQLASWQKGEHLPDLSSLKVLLGQPGMEAERKAVLAARAWGFLLREFKQEGADPFSGGPEKIRTEATKLKNSISNSSYVQKMLPDVALIQRFFMKKDVGLAELEQAIHSLRDTINKSGNPVFSDFYCDWMLARVRARQERFDECLELNRLAVEKASYRSFEEGEGILNQAMAAAAAIGPDRIFCKQIRKLQITLGFEVPYQHNVPDSKVSKDHIQDWEIKLYEKFFHAKYKPKSLGKPTDDTAIKAFLFKDVDSLRYDFKKPDKVVSVPLCVGKKRMPQLAYAVYFQHWDEFNKLLDAGASPDKLTSTEESALLLAIEKLSPENHLSRQDKRYFDALIHHKNKQSTLDQLTTKRRLCILHSAVTSGDPDVVRRVISAGASIDIIATTDHASPLYKALQHLDNCKNPEKLRKKLLSQKQTPEQMDALKRYSNGLMGMGWEGPISEYNNQESDIYKAVVDVMIERHQTIPYEDRVEIIRLLIEAGANCNLEHTYPIKGYTPLMLAVEFGLAEVIPMMLKAGGDPLKTHYQNKIDKHLNCFDLSISWQRKDIFDILKSSEIEA